MESRKRLSSHSPESTGRQSHPRTSKKSRADSESASPHTRYVADVTAATLPVTSDGQHVYEGPSSRHASAQMTGRGDVTEKELVTSSPGETDNAAATMAVYDNRPEGHSARERDELASPTDEVAVPPPGAEDTEDKANTFCESCMDIFFRGDSSRWGDWGTRRSEPHHDTLLAFEAAAEAGCYFCRKLWNDVTKYDRTRLDSNTSCFPIFLCCHDHMTFMTFTPREPFGSRLEPRSFICSTGNQQYRSHSPIGEHGQSVEPSTWANRANQFGIKTSSEQTWSYIETWLQECKINHKHCTYAIPPTYPSRLIDIGDGGPPRSVEQSEVLPGHFYTTLSYCWGKSEFSKLVKANFAQFRTSIPLQALSKTFLDAVEATRRLNVRYIWIDALCIIQDSVEDWEKESLTMDRVYSYALCNLAASVSVDAGGGSFRPRSEIDLHGEVVTAWSSHSNAHYEVLEIKSWGRLMQEPLYKRAWVQQEIHSAPRVSHFGPYQVVWQCDSNVASESFPEAEPYRDEWYYESGGMSKDLFKDSHSALLYWSRAVELYSRASLTRSSDKLPAIAGIANRLMPYMGRSYYAGLWGHNIQAKLSWGVYRTQCSDGTPSFRPKEYRAPSWSWASVEGVIYGMIGSHQSNDSLTQVLDIQVYPVGNKPRDVAGQLAGGYVVLRGGPFLATASVKRRNSGALSTSNIGMGIQVDCIFDVLPENSEALEESSISVVVSIVMRQPYESDKLCIHGLISKQDRTNTRQFVRIGMFQAYTPSDSLETWENNPSPETLALREHVKRDDGGIKIV